MIWRRGLNIPEMSSHCERRGAGVAASTSPTITWQYTGEVIQERNHLSVLSSVRPSTPFSADTDTPIFCCQLMPMPM